MAISQQKDVLTENSYIEDTVEWVDKIYEIDEQDYVHGGLHGYSNVPHEQLANRTNFLKDVIEKIQEKITEFKDEVSKQDNINLNTFRAINDELKIIRKTIIDLTNLSNDRDLELTNQLDLIKNNFNQVVDLLLNHKHNYAGADEPGGDANTVKTENTTGKVQVLGIDTNVNNTVKRINGVFAENDEVYARIFNGDLNGNANTANYLSKPVDISLSGDVSGLSIVNFSKSVNINTTLKVQDSLTELNIEAKGTHFGPTEGLDNIKLDGDIKEFYVPSYVVNNKGLMVESYQHKIILPDVSKSSTAGAVNNTNKLYLIGALGQNDIEETYTQNKVYMKDNKLYSDGSEVVDTSSTQKLYNKKYEGYTLGEACTRAVDDTVGGTAGSSKLVTSNALAMHTHKYAGSKTAGGPAKEVDITINNSNTLFPVIADVNSNKLNLNTTITMGNGMIRVDELYVDESLTIPGGKLWIDTAVDASGISAGILADNTVKYDDTELKRAFANLLNDFNDLSKFVNNKWVVLNDSVQQIQINKNDIFDLSKDVKTNQNNINDIIVNYSKKGHTHTVSEVVDFPSALPANGGRSDYAGTSWTAKCNGQEWSRICLIKPEGNKSICGLLNVETSRTNVNFNSTFLIYVSGPTANDVSIMQLGASNYNNDIEFNLRVLVNNINNIYIDIKDSANKVAAKYELLWHCNWLPLTICDINVNKKFVNGETIPSGYKANEITNHKGNTICADNFIGDNFTGNKFTGDLIGTADHAITDGNNKTISSEYVHAVKGMIMMWYGASNACPDGWAICNGKNGTPDLRDRFVVGAGSNYDLNDKGGADTVTLTTENTPKHSHTVTVNSGGAHGHTGTATQAGGHTHTKGSMRIYGQFIQWNTWSEGGAIKLGPRSDCNSKNGDGDPGYLTYLDTNYGGWTGETSSNGLHIHDISVTAGGAHSHTATVSEFGQGKAHENRPPYYALFYIMKL